MDSVILTIPGIGFLNGAMILGEIGNISRFSNPSKLLAYAGLDPTVNQSGKFNAKSIKMSKRGSKLLRYALINAARNVSLNNKTFNDYFNLKRSQGNNHYKLTLHLNDLTEDEKIIFLTWCDADFNARLHLEVDSKPTQKGYYRKSIWGGASKASAFEEETFDYIDCVYLPPLREAEEKLTSGRKSRLATLLKHQYMNEEEEKLLVEEVKKFNESLIINEGGKYNQINKAREDINETLTNSMGKVFGKSINLQLILCSKTLFCIWSIISRKS